METRYVAEFRVNQEDVKEESKSKESNEVVDKSRKFDSKMIGRALTVGTAATLIASRIYSQMQSTSNSITGNSVAQRRLDNRMAYLNEGLSVFGGLGIAALINPGTAVAVGGALAVSYGLRAFNTAQENQVKQSQWFVESKINQAKQSRLVKDITGIRI